MIIYTRFIRPDMPPEKRRSVPAYAPPADKAQRKESILPRRMPNQPWGAGTRPLICP